MRFNIAKLEQLKKLSSALLAGQKQADRLSEKLRDMDLSNTTQKQRENAHYSLIRTSMGNERLAVSIAELVDELGFVDLEIDTFHDGWAERKG